MTARWHTQDLAGHILDEWADDWTHLDLPAVCEQEVDRLGRHQGDALWPEFYNVKDLTEIKEVIGTREFNSQYQQRPVGAEGSLIKLEWFGRYKGQPSNITRTIQSWDTAYDSQSRHDPSVCTVWGVGSDQRIYLLDVWRKRAEYPDVKKAIAEMYQRWPLTQKILIENRTSGKSIVKDLQQTNLPILPVIDPGSKEIKVISITGLIESGKVLLPESAPWLYEYETEIAQFPVGKHDDQVDSTAQALAHLKKPSLLSALRPMFWK